MFVIQEWQTQADTALVTFEEVDEVLQQSFLCVWFAEDVVSTHATDRLQQVCL